MISNQKVGALSINHASCSNKIEWRLPVPCGLPGPQDQNKCSALAVTGFQDHSNCPALAASAAHHDELLCRHGCCVVIMDLHSDRGGTEPCGARPRLRGSSADRVERPAPPSCPGPLRSRVRRSLRTSQDRCFGTAGPGTKLILDSSAVHRTRSWCPSVCWPSQRGDHGASKQQVPSTCADLGPWKQQVPGTWRDLGA